VLPNLGHADVTTPVANEARLEDSVPLALPRKLGGVLTPWEVEAPPVRQRNNDRRGGCGIRPLRGGRCSFGWIHKLIRPPFPLCLGTSVGLGRLDADSNVAEEPYCVGKQRRTDKEHDEDGDSNKTPPRDNFS
jgi:hypothetical protein